MLAAASTIGRQAYFSYKGLFLWLNVPAYVSAVFLRPGLAVMLYGLTGRFARGHDAAEGFIIGVTAYAILELLLGSILQTFSYERSFGTLGMLFASTASRWQTYLSRCLLHIPNAVMTVAMGLTFAGVVLGVGFEAAYWPGVVLAYGTIVLSGALFSLCIGNFCVVVGDFTNLYIGIGAALIALTGVIIPRDALPPGLFELGSILPISHGLAGLRDAFAGQSLGMTSSDLAKEVLIGLAYATAGFAFFRAIERYARGSGAYDLGA